MSDKSLPRRQEALLRLIARHEREGMVPAAAVLAQEMGLAGESSVTPALRALHGKGFLQVEAGVRGRQRFIRLTPQAVAYLGAGLPVLGTVAAGHLDEALRKPTRLVQRLEELLPFEQGDFLLEVEGESMAGAGILEGDLVLIRPGGHPASGEVAAVWLEDDDRLLLKRYRPDGEAGQVRLESAHPDFPDMEVPETSVTFAGVMRGLVRGC